MSIVNKLAIVMFWSNQFMGWKINIQKIGSLLDDLICLKLVMTNTCTCYAVQANCDFSEKSIVLRV